MSKERKILRTKIINAGRVFNNTAMPSTFTLDLNPVTFHPDAVIVRSCVYKATAADALLGFISLDSTFTDANYLSVFADQVCVPNGHTIVLDKVDIRRLNSITYSNADGSATVRAGGQINITLEFVKYED